MGLLKELNELNKLKELISTVLFYLSILFFIIGFNFSDTPLSGGWYQQFMPNLGGQSLSNITFLDSLNGFAVTQSPSINDTAYILKTTNRGDTWTIKYRSVDDYTSVMFVNQSTGFVSGGDLLKTTNSGENWISINRPNQTKIEDMFSLDTDVIWLVDSDGLTGGAFLTTNGGANWFRRYNNPNSQPEKIYMFNSMIGFISCTNTNLAFFRTTDGGNNWTFIPGVDGFRDIYFADSLTGWKCNVSGGSGMKKTTDGGFNWVEQFTPQGGIIQSSFIYRFSNVSRDTIWGTGGYVLYPNNQARGILYRTINQGSNWLFQIPDTSIHITSPAFIDFVDRLKGWGYLTSPTGIHTTTGGDDSFYTAVKQIVLNVPNEYKLLQNFPNPFNPTTKISYEMLSSGHVKLLVFDITGKVIEKLVDAKQNRGTYSVDFTAKVISSGVYFYSLSVDGKLIDTKKMVLLK